MRNFSLSEFVQETCHNQTEANNLYSMCIYAETYLPYKLLPFTKDIKLMIKSLYPNTEQCYIGTKHITGFNSSIPYPTIEIHASHVCNLNCAYCSHYSPIASKSSPVDVDRMIADIIKLSKIPHQSSYIKQIDVLGGEPLLCNRLEDILVACQSLGNPHTLKFVISNGILVNKDIIAICERYGFALNVTKYPTVTLPEGINPYPFHDATCMSTMPKTIEPSNPCHGKYHCSNGKCLQLRDGAIHLCSVSAYADFPETEFGISIPRSKFDALNLDDLDSYDEVILFSYLQHPFCRHCSIDKNEEVPWAKSSRKLDEWFN